MYQSIDLLQEITLGKEIPVGKKIVVIGGGNVAMDITRSLARLQKIKYNKVDIIATCLEADGHMPADEEEVVEAIEEGATITPGFGPQSIDIIDKDNLKGLQVSKCLGIFDDTGKFNPQFDHTNSAFYEADMIVESIGQGSDLSYISKEMNDKIEYSPRRQIVTLGNFQVKNIPWLFVGGDIKQGPDVITGIANGHLAAKGIDKYLSEKSE